MNKIYTTKEYKEWLKELKQKFAQAQIKAAVKANSTLLEFYWQLGKDIVEKQKTSIWGSGFLKQLSNDLMAEFPNIKGFSYRNLRAIKQWYLFYTTAHDNLATSCCPIRKLNFYIKAVDEIIRTKNDQPTIGILLCKNKDKTVVEYALSDIYKPIAVSEYQLTKNLPENLKLSLPSTKEIEDEFNKKAINK